MTYLALFSLHAKGSFGRLRLPLDITNNDGRVALLEICCRLNNVRATCVGVSQIRNVYEPLWRGEDDELWFGFERLLFTDIQRRDRVARYHHVAIEV